MEVCVESEGRQYWDDPDMQNGSSLRVYSPDFMQSDWKCDHSDFFRPICLASGFLAMGILIADGPSGSAKEWTYLNWTGSYTSCESYSRRDKSRHLVAYGQKPSIQDLSTALQQTCWVLQKKSSIHRAIPLCYSHGPHNLFVIEILHLILQLSACLRITKLRAVYRNGLS